MEAAIAKLPQHQRPPSRELGRVSEAAPNPFAAPLARPPREMAKRCEAVTHPFRPDTQGWSGRNLQDAIDGLPEHQRPDAKSLMRETDVIANPLAAVAAAASAVPVQFPGEDAPAKRFRGKGKPPPPRPASLAPPSSPPSPRTTAKRPTARDGHGGEAAFIAPPNPATMLGTDLERLARAPAPHHHGEGIRPTDRAFTKEGGTLDESGLEQGRFFQTGRQLGSLVKRACPEGPDPVQVPPLPVSDTPMATIEKIGARIELVAVCPAARASGLRPGMALTTARAQLPDLDTRPADREGDAAELARLADLLARRWSPVVEVSDADGLLIDLTGVAHLRGGEAAFCRRLLRLLARHGIAGRIAVADTAGAAWACSRYATNAQVPVHLVPPGAQAQALAPLPPAALRLDGKALELLDRLGVDSVGELAAMPRGPLARRFTRAIVDALDRALGRAPEPLDPVCPRDAVFVRRRFLEPIATPEAIEQVLRDLVPELVAALAQAGRGARSLELVADRVDGVPQTLRIGFARPTRDAAHMLRLMLRRIEEVEPGYGIDAMALHVRRCDALEAEALGPRLAEDTPPELGPLVDAIVNRIGPRRLWRFAPVQSDVPERGVRRAAPLVEDRERGPRLALDDVRLLDETPADHPWHPRWPRPVRLLRRPERVHHVISELPDQPPRRFTWRGRSYRVAAAEGPERITGEWWRRASGPHDERWSVRDYYRVETDTGERFWLYRRGDGMRGETGDLTWYLHGR